MSRRAAPCNIALGTVGRGDAPDMFREARKLLGQRQTESFMSFGRVYRFFIIVKRRLALLSSIPKIEPCLRELVNKKRCPARERFVFAEFNWVTLPRIPCFWRNRLRARCDSQDIQNRML